METEEYFENGLVIGLMVLGMVVLQLCATYIPPPFGSYIGMALYLILSVGGIFFVNVAAQLSAAPHPYMEIIVRPENKKLHAFIDKDLSFGKQLGNGWCESHFKTVLPVKYKDYGKVKEIAILHKGKFSDHVYFRPGTAVWRGIFVNHPAVEVLEVTQAQTATTAIDHGAPIPIFQLLMGSKDRMLTSAITSVGANPGKLEAELKTLRERLSELEMENAKLRRDAIEHQQRALALEEITTQKTAETAGLLEAKVGIKEHAYETFLGLLNAFGRFDKAVEALGGRRWRFTFTKWVALTLIAVVCSDDLWANPQAAAGIQLWLMNPWNFMLVVIALVAILAIILYMGKKKKGG